MKAIKAIAAIMLIASMLTLPVFAAEFVPSIEYEDGPQIVDKTEDTPDVVIVPPRDPDIELDIDLPDELLEEIYDKLDDIKDELGNTPVEEIIDQFEDIWQEITDGAPLENAIIHDLFEIVPLVDGRIEVSFTVDGIGPDDVFVILYKPDGSEEWMILDYTIDENGVITVTIDRQSTVVIITDSGAAPVVAPDAPQSPQTGVYENGVLATVMGVAALGAGVVFCGKKFRKTTVQ